MGVNMTNAAIQPTVLRAESISRAFSLDGKEKPALEVLKGISFQVCEGEIISIIGASGSGKSTLLHILGGLDSPSSGKVFWDDKDISAIDEEALAKFRIRQVGFVFQFHHLLPEFTALENVMIAGMIGGKGKAESRDLGKRLLDRVGMSERLEHKPAELSGGEQQRTAVARALANSPRLIFADEPSGNLDSVSAEHLMNLVHELNAVERQTFVIVTHNERYAERSNRVFRMADGILHSVR
jgi:lipoprotein-releasing system ATP-binding protein